MSFTLDYTQASMTMTRRLPSLPLLQQDDKYNMTGRDGTAWWWSTTWTRYLFYFFSFVLLLMTIYSRVVCTNRLQNDEQSGRGWQGTTTNNNGLETLGMFLHIYYFFSLLMTVTIDLRVQLSWATKHQTAGRDRTAGAKGLETWTRFKPWVCFFILLICFTINY